MTSADPNGLRVQHLQLPARDAATLLPRVEDALRTASRPAALAQHWVLVKQVQLRTPRGASAQALSRQLSRAFGDVLARARPLADATDHDEVVWTTSEAQARVQLLTRWLQERPCTDWFWLPVARGAGLHSAQRPRDDAARAHAIVALLTAPTGQGHAGAAPAVGQDAGAMRTDWWPDAAALFTPAPHWRLAAQVDQRLPARHQPAWLDALRAGASTSHATAPTQEADAAAQPEPVAHPELRPAHVWAGPGALAPPTSIRDPHGARPADTERKGDVAPRPPAINPQSQGLPPTLHGQPSAWAGLWLLLPLLRMTGLASAQAAPAHTAALALGVMQRATARWALDPVCRAWIGALAHRLSQPADAADIDTAWQTLRRHTLAHARLPLQRLLHRPGQVWLAPHRVDVQFPLRGAHIGIRRAGLDIDPGYLPWLDTVVHFHYV